MTGRYGLAGQHAGRLMFHRGLAAILAVGLLAVLSACGIPDTQRSPLVRLIDIEQDTRPNYQGAWLATVEFGNRAGYPIRVDEVDLFIQQAGQGDQQGAILAEGRVDLTEFWIVPYDAERVVVPVTELAALEREAVMLAVAEGVVFPRGMILLNDGAAPIPFGPQPID